MSKLYFLTFANTSYMTTDRIVEQAKEFNMFDEIISKSELDIPEFIEKHKLWINQNPYGYGRWIWKPKIIYDLLNSINDDDFMVYADAGTYLNNKGIERFKSYLSSISLDKEICVFSCNDNYKAQYYVKMDAIMNYHHPFAKELNNACYAGLMCIRKTKNTVEFIKDWLDLCETYEYLDQSLSRNYYELSCFQGQDADNGLFNLCLSKYNNIVYKVYPDEVNIYGDGKQIAHNNINYKEVDWSSHDNVPFQVRRITPKFQ